MKAVRHRNRKRCEIYRLDRLYNKRKPAKPDIQSCLAGFSVVRYPGATYPLFTIGAPSPHHRRPIALRLTAIGRATYFDKHVFGKNMPGLYHYYTIKANSENIFALSVKLGIYIFQRFWEWQQDVSGQWKLTVVIRSPITLVTEVGGQWFDIGAMICR